MPHRLGPLLLPDCLLPALLYPRRRTASANSTATPRQSVPLRFLPPGSSSSPMCHAGAHRRAQIILPRRRWWRLSDSVCQGQVVMSCQASRLAPHARFYARTHYRIPVRKEDGRGEQPNHQPGVGGVVASRRATVPSAVAAFTICATRFAPRWQKPEFPEATMLDIMGHMSTAMLRRYSHIRQAAKVEAIEALEARSAFSVRAPKESPKVGEKPAS